MQHAKYLPKLGSHVLGSFALRCDLLHLLAFFYYLRIFCFTLFPAHPFSEYGSGSDAFALKTHAKPDGNGNFVLNGNKAWITNSGEAEFFVIFATVDPALGYKVSAPSPLNRPL